MCSVQCHPISRIAGALLWWWSDKKVSPTWGGSSSSVSHPQLSVISLISRMIWWTARKQPRWDVLSAAIILTSPPPAADCNSSLLAHRTGSIFEATKRNPELARACVPAAGAEPEPGTSGALCLSGAPQEEMTPPRSLVQILLSSQST